MSRDPLLDARAEAAAPCPVGAPGVCYSVCGIGLNLIGLMPSEAALVGRLLGALLDLSSSAASTGPQWQLHLSVDARPKVQDGARYPRLVIAPGEFEYLVECWDSRTLRLIVPPNCDKGLGGLVINRVRKQIHISVYSPRSAARWVTRMIKQVTAGHLRARGGAFFHGSAIRRDRLGVGFLGTSGSGKSSLAFLAGSLPGVEQLCDDTFYLDPVGTVLPWPKRFGIDAALLKASHYPLDGHVTRRSSALEVVQTGPELDLQKGIEPRDRVFFDVDEFDAVFGADRTSRSQLKAIVFPRFDRTRVGWRLTPLERQSGVTEALRHLIKTCPDDEFLFDFFDIAPIDARAACLDLNRSPPGLRFFRLDYSADLNTDLPNLLERVLQ